MRPSFTTTVAVILAAGRTTLAAPHAPPTPLLEKRVCDLVKCVEVTTNIVCIAGAIARRNVPAFIECLGGAADSACPCVDCISGLDDFLEEFNLCTA